MATAVREREQVVVWEPQPKQALALSCPVFELFYGGAKGGGKSDFLLADFLNGIEYGEAHKGIIFRRTYSELEELLYRSRQIYPALGAKYPSEKKRIWEFPSGATLKMRYLDRDRDVEHYQGHSYTWIAFDELTNWSTDYCYIYMFSCARSPEGIPVRIRASGNPGSKGHVWVKNRFIDNARPYEIYYDPETELKRVFIPALLDDNHKLMEKDPQYEIRLKALPPHLYRAYRKGDWDIFAGQAFEEFRRDLHVIRPISIEPSWKRFAALDWGYAKPYSVGWWAVTGDGRMIRYREWYGCEKGKHNVGVKKASKELAKKAWEISVAEGCKNIVIPPDCFSSVDDTNTVADNFRKTGWNVIRANNDRINGLSRVHDLMKTTGDDGRPFLLVFDTCRAFIRTIPVLVVDENNPEDIDTDSEDHVYDETRYAAMSSFTKAVRLDRNVVPASTSRVDEKNQEYDPLHR